jgi:hypothetical protein
LVKFLKKWTLWSLTSNSFSGKRGFRSQYAHTYWIFRVLNYRSKLVIFWSKSCCNWCSTRQNFFLFMLGLNFHSWDLPWNVV